MKSGQESRSKIMQELWLTDIFLKAICNIYGIMLAMVFHHILILLSQCNRKISKQNLVATQDQY